MCWIWWLPSSPTNLRHLKTLSIFSAHQIVTSLTPWSFLSWNMKDHVLHIFYIIPIRCHHSNCLTFIGWFSSDKHNLSTDRHNLSSDFCILACGYTTLKFQARKCASQFLCYLLFIPCLVALIINFLLMKISQWSPDQMDEVLCHAEWLEVGPHPKPSFADIKEDNLWWLSNKFWQWRWLIRTKNILSLLQTINRGKVLRQS